jgi:hypothetical protein
MEFAREVEMGERTGRLRANKPLPLESLVAAAAAEVVAEV